MASFWKEKPGVLALEQHREQGQLVCVCDTPEQTADEAQKVTLFPGASVSSSRAQSSQARGVTLEPIATESMVLGPSALACPGELLGMSKLCPLPWPTDSESAF